MQPQSGQMASIGVLRVAPSVFQLWFHAIRPEHRKPNFLNSAAQFRKIGNIANNTFDFPFSYKQRTYSLFRRMARFEIHLSDILEKLLHFFSSMEVHVGNHPDRDGPVL